MACRTAYRFLSFELLDECGEMRGDRGREGVVLILESVISPPQTSSAASATVERDQPAADIECRFSDCRDAASVSLLTNFSAQRRHLSAIRSQVALL